MLISSFFKTKSDFYNKNSKLHDLDKNKLNKVI